MHWNWVKTIEKTVTVKLIHFSIHLEEKGICCRAIIIVKNYNLLLLLNEVNIVYKLLLLKLVSTFITGKNKKITL